MAPESGNAIQERVLLAIGTELYRKASRSSPALFDPGGLRGRVLAHAMEDEGLRSALFQFVDTLPQLDNARSIAGHFHSYLKGHRLGGVWGRLLELGQYPIWAWAVRESVKRLARLFLVEENDLSLRRALEKLRRIPAGVTVDAVGEAVLTEAEADAYLVRNLSLLQWLTEAGVNPPNLSLKLSALTPRFDPLDPEGTRQRVMKRLRPLMDLVVKTKAHVTIDMEQHELKPLVIDLFRHLAETYLDSGWLPGIALQAYLPETERDLATLIRWAQENRRRIGVRLVKGAYWDTEIALARQRRWPVPVFLDKNETDAHYERLTKILFDHPQFIYPAIASHNLRSLAHAIATSRERGVLESGWEVQMLYGMAEPLREAIAGMGVRLRIYVPTGELITGIAYLIRRLLENTADTSILRQTYMEHRDPMALLSAPRVAPRAAGEARDGPPFANTPLTDFSRDEARQTFRDALTRVRGELGRTYRLAVPGAGDAAAGEHVSVNPASPGEILGRIELAGTAHAEQAVKNALTAFSAWRDTPAKERAESCLRAAGLMLAKRAELAAWEILEVGKNWREADADVAEAIDYLRFYAAEMMRLDGWRPTLCFPGERNHTRYEARGVAVIVAPWNFPLAILTGMTVAALVSGNTAIMKPAGPAQIIARKLLDILLEAGFPRQACQLVPGRGDQVGDFLVCHRDVHVIAFTGSREVGLDILHKAHSPAPGQTHVKRVVCEMGGKNAIIVDEDADLDEAVTHTLHSAFGYQGQKCSACSRLIAVGKIHDRLVERLAAALDSHPLGSPEDPQFIFGPLVSRQAQEKAQKYLDIGKHEAVLHYLGKTPQEGFYSPPAIFTGVQPQHRLAREEIFAPILSVLRTDDFEQALDMVLDSDYALTGGVFSRLPEHLELTRARFRVGNLYLNRRITGALVAAQPFGGIKLSGTGVQAGGQDYLKQFLWSRTVSENTLRHGFVPPEI